MKVTPEFAKCVEDRMKELNFSFPDVHRESGNAISASSVWNIVNLRTKDVKEDTFGSLAKGLKLTAAELRARCSKEKNPPLPRNTELEERVERVKLGFRNLETNKSKDIEDRKRDAEAFLRALERALEIEDFK